MRTHAPALDYLLDRVRTARHAGTVHVDLALGTEAYVGHVIRLVREGGLTGPEALAAANRAVTAALALPTLPEARLSPRGRP